MKEHGLPKMIHLLTRVPLHCDFNLVTVLSHATIMDIVIDICANLACNFCTAMFLGERSDTFKHHQPV